MVLEGKDAGPRKSLWKALCRFSERDGILDVLIRFWSLKYGIDEDQAVSSLRRELQAIKKERE